MTDIKDRAYKAELARIRVTSATDPANVATCGQCRRKWDDSVSTSITPTPSGRCPFEHMHDESDESDDTGQQIVFGGLLSLPNDFVPVFTNVNEEGDPYTEHDNLSDALELLADYPNDTIVVSIRKGRA